MHAPGKYPRNVPISQGALPLERRGMGPRNLHERPLLKAARSHDAPGLARDRRQLLHVTPLHRASSQVLEVKSSQ
eukprot:6964909-Prymnesium_polylepis.1